MTKDELIRWLAECLAGMQVPLSIAPEQMLGAAADPYRKILDGLPGFGWRDGDEFEKELRKALA